MTDKPESQVSAGTANCICIHGYASTCPVHAGGCAECHHVHNTICSCKCHAGAGTADAPLTARVLYMKWQATPESQVVIKENWQHRNMEIIIAFGEYVEVELRRELVKAK